MTTMTIPLTQGQQALIDDEDHPLIANYKWRAMWNGSGQWYAGTRVRGPRTQGGVILMHRLIADPPEGMVVDHINGNGLDNRRCNMRHATYAQNLANSRLASRSTSGYRGVNRQRCEKHPWRAILRLGGDSYYLGGFPTAEDAARAYDAKAREVFGEFARLNFPDAN